MGGRSLYILLVGKAARGVIHCSVRWDGGGNMLSSSVKVSGMVRSMARGGVSRSDACLFNSRQ
jgi:hypothetical protein